MLASQGRANGVECKAALQRRRIDRLQGFFGLSAVRLVQHSGGDRNEIQRPSLANPPGQRGDAGLVKKDQNASRRQTFRARKR